MDINKLGLKAGIAEIGFEIKKNPNNRQLVRGHLRPRITPFLEAVNEVIQSAGQAFQSKGYAGLVIIVDNLDRVFRNPVPNAHRTSHDALFVDAGDHLRSVACDVIYTVPPALLHSPDGAKLRGLYGTSPQMMPMIPVATRAGEVDEQGVARLVEAVGKRLRYAGTAPDAAFDAEPTIRRLCMTSGGYVRSLMALVQTATNYVDDLPITADAAEQAIRDVRDEYVRSIRSPQQWELLRNVAETRQIAETEDTLRLLENFAVLEYRDSSGPWHDVNPVVREAQQFKP